MGNADDTLIAGVKTVTLEQTLRRPFEVLLRREGNRFVCALPEMGLVASDKSLGKAYEAVTRAREQRIREFASENLLHCLPVPDVTVPLRQPTLLTQLRPFLTKAAITVALFLWGFNMVGGAMREFSYGLEKNVDSVMNWSPEKQEWMRNRAIGVVKSLRPITLELKKLFEETPSAPMAAPPGKQPKP